MPDRPVPRVASLAARSGAASGRPYFLTDYYRLCERPGLVWRVLAWIGL